MNNKQKPAHEIRIGAIKLARRAIAERESWPYGGEFTAEHRSDRWNVMSWRVEYRERDGGV